MSEKKIKVLVVDDSATVREFLVQLLSSDSRLQVVGAAAGGEEAMELLPQVLPDVVTMDVNMPKMDGFEVTRRVMELHPLPVVIVSAIWKPGEATTTFRAVEAGAVAVVALPRGAGHPQHNQDASRLLATVRSMSEVKVVRRRTRVLAETPRLPAIRLTSRRSTPAIVAIGASTGGPTVLQTILAALPKDFPVPLLIVQHIAPGFIGGLVQWLHDTTGFAVKVAERQEVIRPAVAYFAPDDHHLEVAADGSLHLSNEDPDNGLRPSVKRLFSSVAATYGTRSIGVLLTGMGRDGAEELKLMRDRGALTIAQNQETSLVYGMPGEAAKLDAVEYLLAPDQVAAMLAVSVNYSPNRK